MTFTFQPIGDGRLIVSGMILHNDGSVTIQLDHIPFATDEVEVFAATVTHDPHAHTRTFRSN